MPNSLRKAITSSILLISSEEAKVMIFLALPSPATHIPGLNLSTLFVMINLSFTKTSSVVDHVFVLLSYVPLITLSLNLTGIYLLTVLLVVSAMLYSPIRRGILNSPVLLFVNATTIKHERNGVVYLYLVCIILGCGYF